MLQRNVVTSSYEITQSYHMFVGRKDNDKIKDIQFVSMSSFNNNVNRNFITSSEAQNSAGNNLFFGETMSGSVAQIRAWDAYISMSKFKQHILNYNSLVGGTATADGATASTHHTMGIITFNGSSDYLEVYGRVFVHSGTDSNAQFGKKVFGAFLLSTT